jgi:hypothetical protein
MKNFPYIPLLTLFIFIAPFVVWGQDEDFLKFEPLNLPDTIYNKQELDSMHRVDKLKTDDVMVFRDDRDYEHHPNDYYFLIIRNSSFYLSYHLPYENVANYGFIDSTSIRIQNKMLSYEAHDSYRFFSSIDFYIIDLERMTYSVISKYYSSVFDVVEDEEGFSAYYDYKTKSDILFDGKRLVIFNSECEQDDYPISNKGPCYEENYINDGEYHYINGNFVKVKPYINKHHFAHSVFDMGEKSHLTDKCSFYFECDCCANQLVFDSDSTFVVVAPCTQDVSVSYGNYQVKDNQLYLHYSGKWTERYIISDEPNKAPEYAYRDTLVPAHTEVFTPEVCKTTTLFTEQNNTNIKLLRSQQSKEEQLEYLKEVGLLDKLKK